MPMIPKKIHFVWVSKPIPKDYLLSLLNLAVLAKQSGFEFNLWMDKDSDFFNTVAKEDISIPPDLIKLNHTETLLTNARNDPFYQTTEVKALGGEKQFESYIGRESVGQANPGARKDFLATEILRQKGGYFFDADTNFLIKFVNFLTEQLLQEDYAEYGFKAGLEFDQFMNSFKGGNDILGSTENNEILKLLIIEMLTRYKKFDEHPSLLSTYGMENEPPDPQKHNLTLMDKKRKQQDTPPVTGYLVEDRFNLTIKAAGPEVLCDTLKKYAKEHNISPHEFTFPLVKVKKNPHLKAKSKGGGSCFKVMGINVQSVSDQNWIKQSEEKRIKEEGEKNEEKMEEQEPQNTKKPIQSFDFHSSPAFFSKDPPDNETAPNKKPKKRHLQEEHPETPPTRKVKKDHL